MPDLLRELEAWAAEAPESIALDAIGEALTPVAWRARSIARSEELRSAGIRRGDRVAMVTEPTVASLTSLVALSHLETEVLLFDAHGTEREAAAVLDLFDADAIVAPNGVRRRRDRAPEGRPFEPGYFALATSGVTGRPKVVRRSWARTLVNARAFAAMAGYGPKERVLCTTPLHHSYAFSTTLMACIAARATLLLTPPGALPTRAVSKADERRATVVQTIPYVYRSLLAAGMKAPNRARLFISAGEPLSQELADGWRRASDRSLSNHYGTTEAGMITLADPGDLESVGRILGGVRVDVRRDDAASPEGGDGEVVVSSGDAPRYYGDVESRAIQGEWIHTGDLGARTTDGRLVLRGRRSIRLNVGGNKVDPVEVEEAIGSFPGVTDCAAAARRDAVGAELIEALIVTTSEIDELDLRRHLAARLSGYKIPRLVRFVPSLPRSASGKLRRGLL